MCLNKRYLSPLLFNKYIQESNKVEQMSYDIVYSYIIYTEIKAKEQRISMLRFTNDIVLLTETTVELFKVFNSLENVLREKTQLKPNKSYEKL